MHRRWTIPLVLALVVCFSGGWLLQREVGTDPGEQERLFENVLSYVRDYHVDSLSEIGAVPARHHRHAEGASRSLRRVAHRPGLRPPPGADDR